MFLYFLFKLFCFPLNIGTDYFLIINIMVGIKFKMTEIIATQPSYSESMYIKYRSSSLLYDSCILFRTWCVNENWLHELCSEGVCTYFAPTILTHFSHHFFICRLLPSVVSQYFGRNAVTPAGNAFI